MDNILIFPEQTVAVDTSIGTWFSPAPFVLVEGDSYRVVVDGSEYELVCSLNDANCPSLVRTVVDENGDTTTGSFEIVYGSPEYTGTEGGSVAMKLYSDATTCTVAIYHLVPDDPDYLIKESTLIAIADAIRAKTGKTDAILVSNMAAEIASIVTSDQ